MVNAHFTINVLQGYVYSTSFQVVNQTTGSNLSHYLWSWGNGIYSYKDNPDPYVYQSPGIYTIGLTAYDTWGNSDTFYTSISVQNAFEDSLIITQIPDNLSLVGARTPNPFKISVVSSQPYRPLILDLFALNSPSIPPETINNKWGYLAPTWKFLDKNYNEVTSLSVEPVLLYKNGSVVAVSGTSEFYFVDSKGTGTFNQSCPLLITATLQTSGFSNFDDSSVYDYPSYANNKILKFGAVWWVYSMLPQRLKITGNYIDPVYNKQYKNVKIPFLITSHTDYGFLPPDLFLLTEDSDVLSFDGSVPIELEESRDFIGVQLGLSSESGILFENTTNYELSGLVEIKLSNINSFTTEYTPTYFSDKNYIFTYISSQEETPSTTIVAQTTAYIKNLDDNSIIYPGYLPPSPYVWISNPEKNTLNKIICIPFPSHCDVLNYYKKNNILVNGHIREISIPYITQTNDTNYTLSGFSGIYSICIDPRDYSIVATDSEMDRIYRFDTLGNILKTLELSSITGHLSANITPTDICMDGDYNLWISLYDSLSVLKLDDNFDVLFLTTPSAVDMSLYSTPPERDEYFISPTLLESDLNNNCWVTYSYPLCSLLVQYDSYGLTTKQIFLPENSMPLDLQINSDNNLWVSCFHGMSYNSTPLSGSLLLFDSTFGTILSSIKGISRPGYLSLDKNNNLWFTQGLRRFGVLNTETGNISSWEIDLNHNVTHFFLPSGDLTNFDSENNSIDEDFGGLSIDNFNRLWIIDSLKNEAIVFSSPPNSTDYYTQFIKIKPDVTFGYYRDNNGITYIDSGDYYYKSAQAIGDWTGLKWYQKYGNIIHPSHLILSGSSESFNILNAPPNNIRKINESFDMAQYYKNLALPENLKNNTVLFDSFFPAAVGNASLSSSQDLGQTLYEKIANYVINHSDIDTCNIQQLKSLAQQTGNSYKDFGSLFPFDIQRILDITSIPRHKLWGILDNAPIASESIGSKLDTFTDWVTAGIQIVLRNKFDAKTTLYTVPSLGNTLVYPLSNLEGLGFLQPVLSNYYFYKWEPIYSGKYIENIIDWESPYTTLSKNLSTLEDWYGEQGVVEELLRFLLTKNLID